MVGRVIDVARALKAARIHVVVGHGADAVSHAVAAPDVTSYVQTEQLGTGHAALQAVPSCNPDSTVLMLFGDVPLLSVEALSAVVDAASTGPTVLTATLADPDGYGRVVRNAQGGFLRVVEQKDGTSDELTINEVNTGVLAANANDLCRWLRLVGNDNRQGEYYLPDVLGLALDDGASVNVVVTDDENAVAGVNDRVQLEAVERAFQWRHARQLMEAGVHVVDASRLDVRGALVCGHDVVLDVNVLVEGEVSIGDGAVVEANCVLKDCRVAAGAVVRAFSHIDGATVGENCEVGPYARLRPGAHLGAESKIGNFVEVKNSTFGAGAKANHLAYVGDATIGSGANIGAGTITCNYDGTNKHRTVLGENVFVGSNSTLVAPINVDDHAFVAAGSTVTKEVGESQLAVGRAKQRNIDGWTRPDNPKK